MKNYFFLLAIGLLLSGCNEPARNRSLASVSSPQYTNPYYYGPNLNGTPANNTANPAVVDPFANLPAEIKNCRWSSDGSSGFDRQNSFLGDYTFCKGAVREASASSSSYKEIDIYFQFKSSPGAQICFLPLTVFSSGSSRQIGEFRCLVPSNSSKDIQKITLLQNRQGLESQPFSAVLVVKDNTLYNYGSPYWTAMRAPEAFQIATQQLELYGQASYAQAFNNLKQHIFHQF